PQNWCVVFVTSNNPDKKPTSTAHTPESQHHVPKMHPRVKHSCGHEVEQTSYIVQCDEAKDRGSDCSDPTDNYSLGMSSKKNPCPDCSEE
ncbi:hypothetical protein CNYM01_13006, partial [Colletotrichum nymphaeae SA-01]